MANIQKTKTHIPSKTSSAGKNDFVEHYELPQSYGTNEITLITRDPYKIYAYWDINPRSVQSYNQKSDHSDKTEIILRLTALDENGSSGHVRDIQFGSQERSGYIDLNTDNSRYFVDLGITSGQEKFRRLARSNIVETQRARISGRSEMIWMNVDERNSKEAFIYAEPNPPKIPAEVLANAPGPKQNGKIVSRDITPKERLRVVLSEEDIRDYYARMFPLLSRVKLRDKRKRGVAFDDLIDAELDTLYKEDLYADRIGLWELESALTDNLSLDELVEKIFLGSSDLAERRRKNEGPQPFSSHDLQNFGASENVLKDKPEDFFFEIGTELIVYGRTEPGAQVTLNDKAVDLRLDGTFTMRFALPEGDVPLCFVSRSANGINVRTIQTKVQKTPNVSGT